MAAGTGCWLLDLMRACVMQMISLLFDKLILVATLHDE